MSHEFSAILNPANKNRSEMDLTLLLTKLVCALAGSMKTTFEISGWTVSATSDDNCVDVRFGSCIQLGGRSNGVVTFLHQPGEGAWGSAFLLGFNDDGSRYQAGQVFTAALTPEGWNLEGWGPDANYEWESYTDEQRWLNQPPDTNRQCDDAADQSTPLQRVDLLRRLYRFLITLRTSGHRDSVDANGTARVGTVLQCRHIPTMIEVLEAHGAPTGSADEAQDATLQRHLVWSGTVSDHENVIALAWALGLGLRQVAGQPREAVVAFTEDLHNWPLALVEGWNFERWLSESSESSLVWDAVHPPDVEAVPVVELEPNALGVENFIELHDAGTWAAHQRDILAKVDLAPLTPGSWFVPLTSFTTQPGLDLLIDAHVDDGTPEEAWRMAGGYALRTSGGVLEPGCCCDLGDLDDMRSGLDTIEEVNLGIGHAILSFHAGPRATLIRENSEMKGVADDLRLVSTASLREQLVHAMTVREAFAERLTEALDAKGVSGAGGMGRLWVGLESED